MPVRPPSLCKQPGCSGRVNDGVCTICGPRVDQHDRHRPNAAKRGYDARWRKVRAMVLSEEPLCAQCMIDGYVEPATDVDHIVPLRQGGTNRRENLQALCHSCHSKKTNRGE